MNQKKGLATLLICIITIFISLNTALASDIQDNLVDIQVIETGSISNLDLEKYTKEESVSFKDEDSRSRLPFPSGGFAVGSRRVSANVIEIMFYNDSPYTLVRNT